MWVVHHKHDSDDDDDNSTNKAVKCKEEEGVSMVRGKTRSFLSAWKRLEREKLSFNLHICCGLEAQGVPWKFMAMLELLLHAFTLKVTVMTTGVRNEGKIWR